MKTSSIYKRRRFAAEIIQNAVWLYFKFSLSFRDIEDLLAERGIIVSHETIRRWCRRYGSEYARRIRKATGRQGDTWFVDEVFIRIHGQQHYLYRAVDQDGDVLDILVQKRRNKAAAKRFFSRLLKKQEASPNRLVTDKLASYAGACKELMPQTVHDTTRYANNRCENSHQPTRQREKHMRRFKSMGQAQWFLSVHGVIQNLFRHSRHLICVDHYRHFRAASFSQWREVCCV